MSLYYHHIVILHLSLHVGSTEWPQAIYTLLLGHLCSVRRRYSMFIHILLELHTTNGVLYTIDYIQYLTTLPIGGIPPVDTDSCFRALSGIGLQAGAGVITTTATVRHAGLQVWSWRYD